MRTMLIIMKVMRNLWNGGEVATSFSPVARQVENMSRVWSPDHLDADCDCGGDKGDDDGDADCGDDADGNGADCGDSDDDSDDHLLVMTEALLGAHRGNWKQS